LLSIYPFETSQQAGWSRDYYIPNRSNWGPRFGFAWRPFGGSKTVLRGGYGMFFNRAMGNVEYDNTLRLPPNSYQATVLTPGFTDISMYPKLWEASGIPFRELIDKLIQLAFELHREKARTKYAIELPEGSGGALTG
jgi:hypothetical protein